jgi:hypothetical protein
MTEADIRHGQEVRADLTGIRVTAPLEGLRVVSEENTGIIFFCTMGPIQIREVLNPGDDHPLPTEVLLDGLEVPGPGTYDIIDAVIHSNGALRLQADARTQIVRRSLGYSHWI